MVNKRELQVGLAGQVLLELVLLGLKVSFLVFSHEVQLLSFL